MDVSNIAVELSGFRLNRPSFRKIISSSDMTLMRPSRLGIITPFAQCQLSGFFHHCCGTLDVKVSPVDALPCVALTFVFSIVVFAALLCPRQANQTSALLQTVKHSCFTACAYHPTTDSLRYTPLLLELVSIFWHTIALLGQLAFGLFQDAAPVILIWTCAVYPCNSSRYDAVAFSESFHTYHTHARHTFKQHHHALAHHSLWQSDAVMAIDRCLALSDGLPLWFGLLVGSPRPECWWRCYSSDTSTWAIFNAGNPDNPITLLVTPNGPQTYTIHTVIQHSAAELTFSGVSLCASALAMNGKGGDIA